MFQETRKLSGTGGNVSGHVFKPDGASGKDDIAPQRGKIEGRITDIHPRFIERHLADNLRIF